MVNINALTECKQRDEVNINVIQNKEMNYNGKH